MAQCTKCAFENAVGANFCQQCGNSVGLGGRPIVNLRHFPRIAAGQHDKPAVHELVVSIMDNPQIVDVWTGEGQLTLPFAQGEEIADLAPVRVGAGFRLSMSYTVTDLKTLSGTTASE